MEQFNVGDKVVIQHGGWGPQKWSGPFEIVKVLKRQIVLGNGAKFDAFGHSGPAYSGDYLRAATPEVIAQANLDNAKANLLTRCGCLHGGTYELTGDLPTIKAALEALRAASAPAKKP